MMSVSERTQVVSLLRAVAQTSETIYEYASRMSIDPDITDLAVDAREKAADEWAEYDKSDSHYNESCLRAANMVEKDIEL